MVSLQLKMKSIRQKIGIFLMMFVVSAISAPGVWTALGPDGGEVRDIIADPVTPNTFYASTRGGVYKSVDGGLTWDAVNNGITSTFVDKMVHHRSLSGTAYVSGLLAVFKTTDGGMNWSRVNTGLPTSDDLIFDIELAPLTPETLYIGTQVNGVYKTINGGITWMAANTGLVSTINALQVSPSDSSRVYAAVSGIFGAPTPQAGLFETTDGGASWADVSMAIPAPFVVGSPVLNVAFAGFAGEIYITTNVGVFKSSDNGVSWVHQSGLVGREITVNPSNSNEVMISGTTGVWVTTDGGSSWAHILADFIGNTNEVALSNIITYNPFNPTIKFAGTASNGVYIQTITGTSWVQSAEGMNAENIRGLAIAHFSTSSNRIFAGIGDVFSPALVHFVSDDQGLTWSRANTGLDASNFREIEVDPFTSVDIASTHVYGVGRDVSATTTTGTLSGADGGIYKSLDGGTTWSTIDNGIPSNIGPPSTSLFGTVRDITLDLNSSVSGGPAQTLYVAGSGKFTSDGMGGFTNKLAARIYKSVDAGATWLASDTGIDGATTTPFPFPAAVKIVIDPFDSMVLYVTTFLAGFNGGSSTPTVRNGIWKSIDGGANWSHTSVGLPVIDGVGSSTHNVLSLAIDPNNPDRLYASVHNPDTFVSQIYKSEDGAASWSVANTGIATSDVRDIIVATSGDVYAAAAGNSGNPGGVYRSRDFAVSWQSMSVGLDSIVSVVQIDIDETGVNPIIYAGTTQSVHSFEIIPDADFDGVPDVIESAAPNNGDANNDGTSDASQNNVSSLVAVPIDVDIFRSPQGASSDYVTIEVVPVDGTCNTIEDAQSLTEETIPDDGIRSFYYGVIRFEILDCTQANVTLTYHGANEFVGSGWMLRIFAPQQSGATDFEWQDMPATNSTNQWNVTLTDGQLGDIRPNNGRILFQGGSAFNDLIFTNGFE